MTERAWEVALLAEVQGHLRGAWTMWFTPTDREEIVVQSVFLSAPDELVVRLAESTDPERLYDVVFELSALREEGAGLESDSSMLIYMLDEVLRSDAYAFPRNHDATPLVVARRR